MKIWIFFFAFWNSTIINQQQFPIKHFNNGSINNSRMNPFQSFTVEIKPWNILFENEQFSDFFPWDLFQKWSRKFKTLEFHNLRKFQHKNTECHWNFNRNNWITPSTIQFKYSYTVLKKLHKPQAPLARPFSAAAGAELLSPFPWQAGQHHLQFQDWEI